MKADDITWELTKILNEMPVEGSVGYRTEIGDKFRKAMDDLFSTQDAPKTMHDEYGEPNDKTGKHLVCEECGYCKDCGDCDEYGCGQDTKNVVCEEESNIRRTAALAGMNPYDDVFKHTKDPLCECGHPSKEHGHDPMREHDTSYCDKCDCEDFTKDNESELTKLNKSGGKNGRN